MSDYSQITDYSAKDLLATGNPLKLILGADIDAELAAISTAIGTKYDSSDIASQAQAEAAASNLVLLTPLSLSYWGATGTTNNVPRLNAANAFTNTNTITVADNSAGFKVAGATGVMKFHGYHSSFSGSFLQIRNAADNADAPLTVNSSTMAFGATLANFSINGTAASDFARLSQSNTFTAAQLVSANGIVQYKALTSNTSAAQIRFAPNSVDQGIVGAAGANDQFITGVLANDVVIYATSGNFVYGAGSGTKPLFKLSQSGTLTTPNDSASEVGFKGIPQSAQSTDYTLVLADANKHIYGTKGSAQTITIPANASVAFPVGTTITFVANTAGGILVAITTDTLYLAGTGFATSGTRTLANGGIATAVKFTSTQWMISGTGLS